jgi:hypothetical protein
VLLNDNEAYAGKAYDLGAHHAAASKRLVVELDDIAYVTDETKEHS